MAASTFRDDALKGKVALVTGGATGVCYAITETLLNFGCKAAVITSRKEENLKTATEALVKSTGKKVKYVVCDVRSPESVQEMVKAAIAAYGRIDILVNGAAGNFLCAAKDLSYNAFKTVIEIDTIGTFNVTKTVYTQWMKDHGGSIINLTAHLQTTGAPFQVHAGSAKAAIDAMTRHLCNEWGPCGIRVNGIAFGLVADSPFADKVPTEMHSTIATNTPLQRINSKEDVSAAVLYLCSDAGSFVSGTILTVDGGSWMTTSMGEYSQLISRM